MRRTNEASSRDNRSSIESFLSAESSCDVLLVSIEGSNVLLTFEADPTENMRRQAAAVRAVRSRRLLHALWQLPTGLEWPSSRLDPVDIATFDREGVGFVVTTQGGIRRTYEPPGRVAAIAVRRQALSNAVSAVAQLPAVYYRYAFGSTVTRHDDSAIAAAQGLGIGAGVEVCDQLIVHCLAGTPIVGIPGIYRWWLAEIAYEAWLRRRPIEAVGP